MTNSAVKIFHRMCALMTLALLGGACRPITGAITEDQESKLAAEKKPGGNHSDSEIIGGIAIMPNAERLSYISPAILKIRPAYALCVQDAQGLLPALMDCAEGELQFQDARLNNAYQKLIDAYKTNGADYELDVKSIVSAQKAWIAFSNLDCSARAHRFGSTRGPTTQIECHMNNTALRAQQLEDWKISLDKTHLSS